MDYISMKKDDDVLEFLYKAVKENQKCAIYLTPDMAVKLLDYARTRKAYSPENDKMIGDDTILRCFMFDDGFGTAVEVNIRQNFQDRSRYLLDFFKYHSDAHTFSYSYNRNYEKAHVVTESEYSTRKEVVISDKPYVKEKD